MEGQVTREGAPVSTGYARLLGSGDEFVAEVPLGDDGGFRFFAAPGSWTLRVLAPNGLRAEQSVQADNGQVTKVEVSPLAARRQATGAAAASCGGRAR